jgi:hypothetical protein
VVGAVGLAPTSLQPLGEFLLLAEAATREKLPPPTRAAVMMALLAIALLGMFLVVIVLLGGHWVRRQGSIRRGPSVPPDRAPILTPPAASPSAEQDDAADTSASADTVIPHDTRRERGEPS